MVIAAACLFFITKKPEEAPEYVLFYAENQTADYPTTLGAQRFAEQAPEMNVLQLPYLYRDSEHMWRGLDREILRECARESAEYERVL